MPKYSPQAFAQRVKSTNPALGQLDDNTAVQVWLKQYPGDREYLDDPGNLFGEVERAQKLLAPPTDINLPLEEGQTRDPRLDLRVPEPLPTVEPPSNTLYEMAKGAPTALRMSGGILGATAGGIAGSVVPGAGTAAGVATGGMAGQAGGEFLAQLIERHVIGGAPEMTPMQAGKDAARIALNAALGGYVPKALDPTTAAVKVLGRRAVEGGLIGAGAVGLDVGLEGRLPTAPELAMSAGMGAGAGLVGGALEARSLSKVAAAQAANKRAHEALQMTLRNKAMVEGFQPPIGPERQLAAGPFVAGERGIAAPGMEYPRVESRLTHQMPPDATPTAEEIGQILPQPRDIAAQYSGTGEPIRWNPPDEDVVYTGSGRTLLSEFGVPNTLDEQMEKLGRPFVPPTTETGTVVGSPLYGITPGEPGQRGTNVEIIEALLPSRMREILAQARQESPSFANIRQAMQTEPPPPAPAPTTETIPVTDLPPPARGPLTPTEIQAADTTPPPAEMMGGGKAGPQFQKMLSLGGPAAAMAIPEDENSSVDNFLRAGLIGAGAAGIMRGKVIPKPAEVVKAVQAARQRSLARGTGDGATFNLRQGDMWGSGKFAVGVQKFSKVFEKGATDSDIAAYVNRYRNLLKQPEYSVGVWQDTDTGKTYLDVVRLFDDEKTARAFGRKQDQIAIGQLHPDGFKEIRLKPAPSEMVGLEHRSLTEGLTEIDPSYYEPSFLEGRRGAQAIPRSYYTKKGGFVEARFKGMPNVYEGEVPQEGLYDIVTDPLGIRAKAQARGEDWALDMERGIKEAGFKGYHYSSHENPMFRDTVVMFEKLPVKHRFSEPYLRQLEKAKAERGVQMAGPLAKAGAFAAGAATGAALGDTPEERVTLGLGLGAVGAGLVRGPKKPPKLPKGMSQKAEQLLTAQASDATGSKGSILPLASRAKQAVVSRFAPQDFLAEQAEKNIGRKLRPEEHPGEMNRIVAGGTGGRTRAAKYELEDLIGESKKAGLEPELRLYLNMKGILHGAKTLEGRGAAKVASGEAFPLKYTPEEAERELAEQMKRLGPEKAKQLEAMGSKLFDFNRQTLEMIKPIIPKSTYDELVERGKEYVPLYRRTGLRIEDGVVVGGPDGIGTQHVERLKGAGLSLNQIKSLQKLEGSEMITQDPLQASLYLRRLAEQELGRNQAAQTLYNLRKIDPNGVGKAIVPLKGDIRPPRGHEELSFRFNGPDGKTYVQRFAVPSEVAQAQKMLDGIELMAGWTTVGGVLGGGKTVLQASATGLNIPFAIWNVQRDFRTARRFLKGQKQFNPSDAIQYAREWGEALRNRLRKNDNFREALKARALHGTLQETLVPQSLKLGKEPEGAVRFVLRNISDWNRALEETTKLSAYNRVKSAHPDWSPDQIAQEVRKFGGSPDFADSGTLNARGLGLAFMFLNPGIQGIAQNMRGIGRAPGKAALMLGTAIGASIALYRWNSQFIAEDGRPEIEHVPKHDRDASFVILLDSKDPQTGRRHYLTVFPKSHADRLFYNTVQDAIQMAAGDTGITPGQLAADAASQFLPGSFQLDADEPVQSLLTGMAATSNPVIRVPLELAGNRRAYENIPIESQRELRLPPQSRYDARTSPLAVKVGKVTGKATEGFPDFLTLGPKKVEQVMRTFGAPGQMLTSSIDTALNRGSEKMQPEGLEKVKKLPVVGLLVARGIRGGGDQRLRDRADKVYDRFDLAEKTANELASVEKREPARLEQFLRDPENIKRLTEADVLREGLSVLGELRTQRELILNGTVKPGNPSAELRRLREIEAQLMAQLEQALKLR